MAGIKKIHKNEDVKLWYFQHDADSTLSSLCGKFFLLPLGDHNGAGIFNTMMYFQRKAGNLGLIL